jgi:hypothetical protein
MNPQRMARFVRRWFAEWEAERWGRATQILQYLIDFRPDEAWMRILALVSEAKEQSLGNVGAGPLEDLLSAKGNQVIPWLEAEAKLNPCLVKCVGAVWGDLRFEPGILQRVRNISPITSC